LTGDKPETKRARLKLRQKENKAHVTSIRANTRCEECGGQPIEWHNPKHAIKPQNRIGNLVNQAVSLAKIDREIAESTALCRRCHMKEDGRLAALAANAPRGGYHVKYVVSICIECGRECRPLRKGLCSRCYDKMRYRKDGPRVRRTSV
jgi:hypothetical protein